MSTATMHILIVCANYLLNALWQVPLVFGAAWLIARAVRGTGPAAEHRVWVAAMLVQIVLPAVSLGSLDAVLRNLTLTRAAGNGSVTVVLGVAHPLAAGTHLLSRLQACAVLYAAVTAFFAARLLWQWLQLRRIVQAVQPVSLSAGDDAFFQACQEHLHTRDVRLAAVPAIGSPLTLGVRQPWLLLPCDFVVRVSTQQLQTALAHELAHVQRRDYAKHLAYRILTLPIAFHPACWTTLARITETREQICDGTAAKRIGSRKQYASSLLQLASLLAKARQPYANAIGMFDANHFERRITMLTQTRRPLSRARRLSSVALSGLLALAACTSAVALRINLAAPAPRTSTENPRTKVPADVMAGQVLNKVTPKYPEDAKKAKISGQVVLAAIIGKDGSVENLRVISGPQELLTSALDAVRQWTYKPYLLNGEPTAVETTITINYSFSE